MLKELTGAYSQKDDALSLSYQNAAFRLAGEQMKDPTQHASDELLGSVGSFMCHHVRVDQMRMRVVPDLLVVHSWNLYGLGAPSQCHGQNYRNEGWHRSNFK
jgi:hypothetical protein